MLPLRTPHHFKKQSMNLSTASLGLCASMPVVVLNSKILTVASKAYTILHSAAGTGKWFSSSCILFPTLAYLLEETVSGYTSQKTPLS